VTISLVRALASRGWRLLLWVIPARDRGYDREDPHVHTYGAVTGPPWWLLSERDRVTVAVGRLWAVVHELASGSIRVAR
jgi:hypothetical protein